MATKVSKSWVYTLNNFTEQELAQFKAFTAKRHRCAHEDEGTPHLQGAITFTRAYRLAQLKKLVPRAHWEMAKCSDAENYCTKGEILIDINNAKQGSRTDLQQAVEVLKTSSVRECARKHPETYVKYHKGIVSLKAHLNPRLESFTPTKVSVYYGPPGTGKTRQVFEDEKKVYIVPQSDGDKPWFDGYDAEEAILFDDFYGNGIKYDYLLKLLDGYPMRVPYKGGFYERNWTRVYLTSNTHPSLWYSRSEWQALKRRISNLKKF